MPRCELGVFDVGDVTCTKEVFDDCIVGDPRGFEIPPNGTVGPACKTGATLAKDRSCELTCNEGYTLVGSQPTCLGSIDGAAASFSCCLGVSTAGPMVLVRSSHDALRPGDRRESAESRLGQAGSRR